MYKDTFKCYLFIITTLFDLNELKVKISIVFIAEMLFCIKSQILYKNKITVTVYVNYKNHFIEKADYINLRLNDTSRLFIH